MVLSSRYIVLETWMITQVALLETWWRWVLTYMLIGWFLHMLIDANFPKWWYMDNLVDKMAMVFYTYDIIWMILWWWIDIYLQTYSVIGQLQVTDLELVVREFHKEYPHIYACFCGYSRVYVNQRAKLRMRRVWYGPDRNHLAQMEQVQRENMITGLDIVERCLWSRSYIMYDSC